MMTLGEAAERVDYGLTASASTLNSGPRFLRITDIVGGQLDLASVPYVETDDEMAAKYLLRKGDIVVARTGASVGTSHWFRGAPEPVVFASYLVRFRVHRSINSRYIAYVLTSSDWAEFIRASAHSKSAQPNLSAGAMTEFQFHLPERREQDAIAEVLGALDDKIAANRQANDAARILSITIVDRIDTKCLVSDLALTGGGTISPQAMNVDLVTHYSLPAFDVGHPAMEAPGTIKSAKQIITEPVVLVSKLNPRIPRIWAIDELPEGLAVASTEFVPLLPHGRATVGSLWAAVSQREFSEHIVSQVAGTTGSHQRVRPSDILQAPVVDVRELSAEDRQLLDTLCRSISQRTQESLQLATTRDELLPLLMDGTITVRDAEKRVEDEV